MGTVAEEEVVWQYIRWHSQYQDVAQLDIIRIPDFADPAQNKQRWAILARDEGHVLRVRYPYDPPPRPYHWTYRLADPALFSTSFSNFLNHSGRLLRVNELASEVVNNQRLPDALDPSNLVQITSNVQRLKAGESIDAFNAIILCRPTPGVTTTEYRIVEGSKRAIAYRIAQLRNLRLPEINCYFGDYL